MRKGIQKAYFSTRLYLRITQGVLKYSLSQPDCPIEVSISGGGYQELTFFFFNSSLRDSNVLLRLMTITLREIGREKHFDLKMRFRRAGKRETYISQRSREFGCVPATPQRTKHQIPVKTKEISWE